MDDVEKLPTDDNVHVTPDELSILQRYFQEKSEGRKLYYEIREVIFGSLIFLLLANPLFDKMLDYVPHMGSPLIKLGAKVVLFFILFYITVLSISNPE